MKKLPEVLPGYVHPHLFRAYKLSVEKHVPLEAAFLDTCGEPLNDPAEGPEGQRQQWLPWLQAKLGDNPIRVGRYWFSSQLQRCTWEQLHSIHQYFTDAVIEHKLLPIIKKQPNKKQISLRALDWLVTNFSKKNRIIYNIKQKHGRLLLFNMYLQYKTSLNRYRRHVFDPFRRHERVYFIFKGYMYSSTVGQLNFMRWALSHAIIEYAQSRIVEIEADMAKCIKENQREKEDFKKTGTKRRRKPLSDVPPNKCYVYNIPEHVTFVNQLQIQNSI